jgi:hypothetical protein
MGGPTFSLMYESFGDAERARLVARLASLVAPGGGRVHARGDDLVVSVPVAAIPRRTRSDEPPRERATGFEFALRVGRAEAIEALPEPVQARIRHVLGFVPTATLTGHAPVDEGAAPDGLRWILDAIVDELGGWSFVEGEWPDDASTIRMGVFRVDAGADSYFFIDTQASGYRPVHA